MNFHYFVGLQETLNIKLYLNNVELASSVWNRTNRSTDLPALKIAHFPLHFSDDYLL